MSAGNRLKRKLEDMGVDLASRKANENFCLIGTPLPPLEKTKKDAGEFVPLWKQEVRDEKGRRRLHGAFTGGFSAGYFNTVGSKEGWAPSTFVSSRSDRVKQKQARPEDFMDDEDLQDIKDSRTIVDQADEMDLTGATGQPSEEEKEMDSLAAALEASMLPPPSDSAGARILKKMGWRLGQGIGPRLSFNQKRLQDAEQAIPVPQEENEEDAEAQKHLYPRRDTKVMLYDRKDNSWGLGYSPGMGLNESVGIGSGKKAQPKGPNISSGFGLGALNDADDDDVDVYDPITGHTSHRRREAYDFNDDQEDYNMGGINKSGRYPASSPNSNILAPQFFRDGQPVLKGFNLSNKAVLEDRWFPLPEIPKGWTPNPKRVWEKRPEAGSKGNKENVPQQTGQGGKAGWDSKMSADERGQLLGETPLPAAPRSVFDFMSRKDRERLESIKANISAGQPKETAAPFGEVRATSPGPLPYSMPRTEPQVASAALRGFRPFAADPAKQARYETYLRSQLPSGEDGTGPGPELKPSNNQKQDEFRKEVEDYAKAALLFKPMSGAMAGRFQSAGVVEMGKLQEGFQSGSGNEMANKKAPAPAAEKEDSKVHAAKMGMYGGLTREVRTWIPARLLCKRFGVKDPDVSLSEGAEGATAGTGTSSAAGSSWQGEGTQFEGASGASEGAGGSRAQNDSLEAESSGTTKKKDLANIGLGEDDEQGRDTLTYERPSMEVFKAIFASDDEDEDEEDGDQNITPQPEPSITTSGPSASTAVSQPLPAQNEPVDLSTFKPTFIPRAGKDRERHSEKSIKKEQDKKKKEKKTKAVLSFEMDEEGGDKLEVKVERPKKKKKKERQHGQDKDHEADRAKTGMSEGDEDDSMWVEKPVAEAVKDLLPVQAQVISEEAKMMEVETTGTGPRGRKRAIDFL